MTLGLKGSLREPSTWRRPLRSPSEAWVTIGSSASTASLSAFTATVGASAGAGAGSLARSIGTAAAAATRRMATGHSRRPTRKRQVSLITLMG